MIEKLQKQLRQQNSTQLLLPHGNNIVNSEIVSQNSDTLMMSQIESPDVSKVTSHKGLTGGKDVQSHKLSPPDGSEVMKSKNMSPDGSNMNLKPDGSNMKFYKQSPDGRGMRQSPSGNEVSKSHKLSVDGSRLMKSPELPPDDSGSKKTGPGVQGVRVAPCLANSNNLGKYKWMF